MMGITAIFAILLVGEIIAQIDEPIGYQLAFVLGGVGFLYFAKISDRQTKKNNHLSKDRAF